jgi:predicted RNA binding protein YcfA (HicA-like mRNA interferase family)
MGKSDKIFKKMQDNPKNVDFKQLRKVLESSGYECINTGGSHFVFRKDRFPSITIPFKRPIKIIYVKKVLKILENEND